MIRITLVPKTTAPYSRLPMISGVITLPATLVLKYANALIEHEFDGYSRISAGKYGSKRLLLLLGVLLKYGEVLLVGDQFPRHKALVALRQGRQWGIGCECGLRVCLRGEDRLQAAC